MEFILASASPRRAELLASAGLEFAILPAEIDETPRAGEVPGDYAMRMAHEKAAVVRARCPSAVVLGADTVVIADGEILGKPTDAADAARMLNRLSDRVHVVHTAVVLSWKASVVSELCTTRVHFRPMSQEEIAWYISTGEPYGKAGAYAIQGRASRFIDWIDGSWSNVVGLPVATVHRMLRETSIT
jgi:septum formation protein